MPNKYVHFMSTLLLGLSLLTQNAYSLDTSDKPEEYNNPNSEEEDSEEEKPVDLPESQGTKRKWKTGSLGKRSYIQI